MNIKLTLIFVVMVCAMQQGPVVYRDLKCVEPVPDYAKRFLYYFTASEFEKHCPSVSDLAWKIGNEVFYTLLCVLFYPAVGLCAVGRTNRQRVSKMESSSIHLPPLRYCPCLAKRSSLRKPSGTRKRDKANFAKRSNAMMLFYYGLELSVVLTKERPWNNLFLVRKSVQHFEEEQMLLFPICIQRHINCYYPVPR